MFTAILAEAAMIDDKVSAETATCSYGLHAIGQPHATLLHAQRLPYIRLAIGILLSCPRFLTAGYVAAIALTIGSHIGRSCVSLSTASKDHRNAFYGEL